jgi:hypothetical protein
LTYILSLFEVPSSKKLCWLAWSNAAVLNASCSP